MALLILAAITTTMTTTVYGQQLTTTTTNNTTTISLNNTTITTANATTNATASGAASAIITEIPNLTGEAQPLSAEVIQYQQQDQTFAKLVQLVSDCTILANEIATRPGSGKSMNLTDINKKGTCDTLIEQVVEQFCQFGENLDVAKCNAAREVGRSYLLLSEVIDRTVTL